MGLPGTTISVMSVISIAGFQVAQVKLKSSSSTTSTVSPSFMEFLQKLPSKRLNYVRDMLLYTILINSDLLVH